MTKDKVSPVFSLLALACLIVMQHVTRVSVLMSTICPQAEWRHEPSTIHPGWPTQGCIAIRGFGLRYRHDLDLAIRNITITINGGEKVGPTVAVVSSGLLTNPDNFLCSS